MNSVIATYGCHSSDDDIRYNSSSGGVFTVLAESVIKNGGVIYGTAMSDDCREAVFQRVDDVEGLSRLRGSKYLQSRIGDAYRQIKADLQRGIQVFFSGCPCQVNGLKLFLGKEYDNLICMDIICHGVPSPELWKKYIVSFEAKNHTVLKSVNFRSKAIGWSDFGLYHDSGVDQWFSHRNENPYMLMFLKNYDLRPSCYECSSKTFRTADISIGDFWGINRVLPELSDTKGTSLVLIRSEKGLELFDRIKGDLTIAPCTYGDAITKNYADYMSVPRPAQRDTFYDDMSKLSFERLERKYLGSPLKRKLKKKIKKIIGRK